MDNEPNDLNTNTPQWFRDWHNKEFWHFKAKVEDRLCLHGKLIWIVLSTIIIGLVATYFGFGN